MIFCWPTKSLLSQILSAQSFSVLFCWGFFLLLCPLTIAARTRQSSQRAPSRRRRPTFSPQSRRWWSWSASGWRCTAPCWKRTPLLWTSWRWACSTVCCAGRLYLLRGESIIVLHVAETEAEEGGGRWFPSEQRAEGISGEKENKDVNHLTTSAVSAKCLESWTHLISCFYISTDWRMDTSHWAGWASSDSWLQNIDIRVSSAVIFPPGLMSLSHSDVCRQNQQFDWFSNCEEPVGRLQPIRAHDKGERGTQTNTSNKSVILFMYMCINYLVFMLPKITLACTLAGRWTF